MVQSTMVDRMRKLFRPSGAKEPKTAGHHELFYGKTSDSIPNRQIAPLKDGVISAFTGPNSGITQLTLQTDRYPSDDQEIAGSKDWNIPTDFAYGLSLSLYEEDVRRENVKVVNGVQQRIASLMGDPVADVFGVVTRENSAILAVADGVNWGTKPRLAARCAVRTALEHITTNLGSLRARGMSNTRRVIEILLDCVHKAHKSIIDHKATLTTLSIAFACEMQGSRHGKEEWGLFVVSVGDSPVYVYCPVTQEVHEVTIGCHAHDGVRDMRNAGGALGPAIGTKPDLDNLTVAYMPVFVHDIIFIASDGISDNFQSQVIYPSLWTDNTSENSDSSGDIPNNDMVVPVAGMKRERELTPLLKTCCDNKIQLTGILRKHQEDLRQNMSAQTVAACLMNFAVEITEKKRRLRSDCLSKNIDIRRKAKEDPVFRTVVESTPGKLDHATIAAYQIGQHR